MISESKIKKTTKNLICAGFCENGIKCVDDRYVTEENSSNREAVKNILFRDKIPEEYDNLYDQAIGGSGCEDANMTNIISSALWAFLFFANVSEKHPLKIKNVEYVHVCFEFKNRTLDGNSDFAPSNIDVVLADAGFEHIMFVESKFSEYIYDRTDRYDKLSSQYYKKGNTKDLIDSLRSNEYFDIEDNEKHIIFKNKESADNASCRMDDFLRVLSKKTVKNHDLIFTENLKVRNMRYITNRKGGHPRLSLLAT